LRFSSNPLTPQSSSEPLVLSQLCSPRSTPSGVFCGAAPLNFLPAPENPSQMELSFTWGRYGPSPPPPLFRANVLSLSLNPPQDNQQRGTLPSALVSRFLLFSFRWTPGGAAHPGTHPLPKFKFPQKSPTKWLPPNFSRLVVLSPLFSSQGCAGGLISRFYLFFNLAFDRKILRPSLSHLTPSSFVFSPYLAPYLYVFSPPCHSLPAPQVFPFCSPASSPLFFFFSRR